MGELLLMAAGTYFGIMFCVACISSAYRMGGVFGIIALIACVIIGCAIVSSSDSGESKKQ